MLLAHKIELRPTDEQVKYFTDACNAKRHCYNQMLAHVIELYRSESEIGYRKSNMYFYLMDLLRDIYPWYMEVSSTVTLHNALGNLDSAFKNFFDRIAKNKKNPKNKVKVGFPRFKSKGKHESFSLLMPSQFEVNGRKLKIEKLPSWIDMREKLRFEGKLKQLHISERAGKWYASILVDTDYVPSVNQDRHIIGVDLGIHNMAVLSDGTEFPANQKLKDALDQLARINKRFSKKPKFVEIKKKDGTTEKVYNQSNRREKVKLLLQKQHRMIADKRQAVLHNLTDYLTKNYEIICIEDLNVKGMVRNHCLARAITDAGFGEFRRQLEYKAAYRGCLVVVINRFMPTSKACCICGNIDDTLTLEKREYICECGNVMNRDLNAAINIEQIGLARLNGETMEIVAESELDMVKLAEEKLARAFTKRKGKKRSRNHAMIGCIFSG